MHSYFQSTKFYDNNMDGHDTSEKLIDFDSPPSTFQNQNDEGDRLKKSNFYCDLDEPPDDFGNLSNSLSTMGFNTTAGRDRIVTEMMKDHEDQYTELKSVKIFVGTWNVNGQSASEYLGENWLACDISPPDIYAIGFQELDLSKEAFLFTDSPRESEWLQACFMGLHQQSQYELVKLVRLVGMMLIVFIKKELMPYVSQVCEEKVGTGILGKMGNKGGVAVRFNLYNSSLCFVNSHLAAHVDECERRNQDYNEINSRLSFSQMKPSFFIKDHDQVFWLGDLNYRLMDLNTDQVKNLLYANAFNNLLEHDQLKIQQKLNKVFQDYKEGEIRFLPTYKYDPGTDQWDSSEKNRPPAWCDRILWRGGPIKQITYRSHNKLMLSDHKPVSSLFESSIKVIDRVKYDKVYQDTMKLLDKLENEFLPQVMVDKLEINFDGVKFRQAKIDYLSIANTGQVPVNFVFINKPNDKTYCKNWLRVRPSNGMMKPGDKLDIELQVFVDHNTASKLNSGEQKIEDILVLHLDGGKDFFITVSGSYIPSCFGSSVETLVRLKSPIQEIDVDVVYRLERKQFQNEYQHPAWDIPKELFVLVDNLYKYCMLSAEIFQTAGLLTDFQKIRDAIDCGWPERLPGSVLSIAEALLIFLESIREPIIPNQFYLRALECSKNFIDCKQIINEIPKVNRNIFYYLIAFLRELLHHSNSNKLDSKIIANIFGVLIVRIPEEHMNTHKNVNPSDERKKAAFIYHFLVNDFDI